MTMFLEKEQETKQSIGARQDPCIRMSAMTADGDVRLLTQIQLGLPLSNEIWKKGTQSVE